MLCEGLSKIRNFLNNVLPLPCNVCIHVTSERRRGDGIMVSHNYQTHVIVVV